MVDLRLTNLIRVLVILSMVAIAESAGFEFSANQFLGQSDGFNNNTLEEDYLSFSFP